MRKIKILIYQMEAAQMEKTCCVTGHRDMDEEQTDRGNQGCSEKGS